MRGCSPATPGCYQCHGSRQTPVCSESDFPNILANVANKTLRTAYEAAPRTFQPFCRQVTASDFKAMSRVQLGEAPALDKVNEGGEYKRGPLGEGKESYRVETYGKIIAISRQVLVNDDLNAFTRIPQLFGVAAANLESDVVWGIITANPNMGDGLALDYNVSSILGIGVAIPGLDVSVDISGGNVRLLVNATDTVIAYATRAMVGDLNP